MNPRPTTLDPVCGMTVETSPTARKSEYSGEAYYFCSEDCRQKFESHPTKFVSASSKNESSDISPAPAAARPQARSKTYICPMHPQIEQDRPGTCPICGMALEPKTIAPGQVEDNGELQGMTLRFWIGGALTLPIFLLAMAHLFPGRDTLTGSPGTRHAGHNSSSPRPWSSGPVGPSFSAAGVRW